MQPFSVLFLCVFFAAKLSAQQVVLHGYLKDSLTQLPIAGGTLSNSSLQQKTTTGPNGYFRMVVSPGDLLYALAPRYRYDTLRYTLLFRDTITLFLQPVEALETVTVETGYRRYQQDSLRRRTAFEESRGAASHVFDKGPKSSFGLTLNLDRLFKRKDRNKGRQEAFFARQERQAYINARFSPQLVSFYTGLKGAPLLNFLQWYTPSYEWLRAHPQREHLVDYLSLQLKAFRSRTQ